MSAKVSGAANRVPPLLDVTLIGFLETIGQAHNAVLEFRAFQIANAIERRELAGRKLPHAFNDGLDQIAFRVCELLGLSELIDPGVHSDGEQLVLCGRCERGHWNGSF